MTTDQRAQLLRLRASVELADAELINAVLRSYDKAHHDAERLTAMERMNASAYRNDRHYWIVVDTTKDKAHGTHVGKTLREAIDNAIAAAR